MKVDADIRRLDTIIDNFLMMGLDYHEMVRFFKLAIIERTAENSKNMFEVADKLNIIYSYGYRVLRKYTEEY